MSALKAVLWDIDGTVAETERDGHRVAFNRAFEASGLDWCWDDARYGELLRITGGRERLMHDMSTRSDAPTPASARKTLARAIHQKKNAIYAELMAQSAIPLRGGVLDLMRECRDAGVRMGIATTTSRTNVQALMSAHLGERWSEWFAVIVCGEDVQRKKPDPEVYLNALRGLGIGPLEAVAIEDSPGGVSAARAAYIPVVVTRSVYFPDTAVEGAVAIGPGLHDRAHWLPPLSPSAPQPMPVGGLPRGVGLDDLRHWCAQMDLVSQYP